MEDQMPELKDIREMINRYNAVHKEGCFVFSFLGVKKDPEHQCVDCGKDCDEYDESKSHLGAYGNVFTLREMLNDLRDVVEDSVEEDGFVNV